MDQETIGGRLKRLREAAELTQTELATRAGVSQGTIGNIESNIRGYGKSVVRIASTLKVSTEYLTDLGERNAEPETPAHRVMQTAAVYQVKRHDPVALAVMELCIAFARVDKHSRAAAINLLSGVAEHAEDRDYAEMQAVKIAEFLSPPAPPRRVAAG